MAADIDILTDNKRYFGRQQQQAEIFAKLSRKKIRADSDYESDSSDELPH
jgi:hypothetical protein